MLARASLDIAALDLTDAAVAFDLHRVWRAAYTLEAQWLGEHDFPPLRLDAAALRDSGYRFLGARLHGQLLGALAVEDHRPAGRQRRGGDVQVAALVVDPVHHGEGIARELIAEFQRTIDADGAFAHTAVANAAARMAFGRMGFLWHRPFTLSSSADDDSRGTATLAMVELRWRRRRIDVDAPVSIRRLAAGEHGLHRALRLRALRQDADAFVNDGDVIGALSALPDAYWESRTLALAPPSVDAMFVAERATRVCGCIVSRRDRDDPSAFLIESLWVDPAQRRKSVGRELLDAAAAWAAQCAGVTLRAWVPVHRADALALHLACGFERGGASRTLPSHSAGMAVELLRRLHPAANRAGRAAAPRPDQLSFAR